MIKRVQAFNSGLTKKSLPAKRPNRKRKRRRFL